MPEVCEMSWRTVTLAPYGHESTYRSTGSSSPTFPPSTSCSTATAVIVLLIEYAIMVVAVSTGTWRRMFAHPLAYSNTTSVAFTTTY